MPVKFETSAERSEASEKGMMSEEDVEVGWDEPADQDPVNPVNWGVARKWTIIGMVSFITFLA
jgi:hypothetical protein